jgi:hypothetical protein
MKTALCLTPDRAFFRQAICTAATILEQGDADQFDVFVVCENHDVAPGFERLAPALLQSIELLCADFSALNATSALSRSTRTFGLREPVWAGSPHSIWAERHLLRPMT